MIEHYEIENLEQLRAISDMLRIRIVDLLMDQPRTVTQLADVLGMTPARVHYHVRELERVGLLRLVETRERGGILEKYFQPIARDISIPKNLLFSAPPDEVMATMSNWFDQVRDGFLQAMRSSLHTKNEHAPTQATFSFGRIYTTYEEFGQITRQFSDLLRPFEKQRAIPGEQEVLATLILTPQNQPVIEHHPSLSPQISEDDGSMVVTPPGPEEASMLNTWVLGVTSITRAQLEETLGNGKRLRISVVGLCRFSDDVTPELAELAVESLRLVGKLQASPQVYEVIMQKRQM